MRRFFSVKLYECLKDLFAGMSMMLRFKAGGCVIALLLFSASMVAPSLLMAEQDESDSAEIEERLARIEVEIEESRRTQQKATMRLVEGSREMHELRQEVVDEDEDLKALRDKIAAVQKEYQELMKEYNRKLKETSAYSEMQSERQDLMKELQDSKKRHRSLVAQRDDLKRRLSELVEADGAQSE